MRVKFDVSRVEIERVLNAVSAPRPTPAEGAVVEVDDNGLTAYDRRTAQMYTYLHCRPSFFTTPPKGATKFVLTKTVLNGLRHMRGINIRMSTAEVGTGMWRLQIEDIGVVDMSVYSDPIVIPDPNTLGFPKRVGRYDDNVMRIEMTSPTACVVDVHDTQRLRNVPDLGDRYVLTFHCDGTLSVKTISDAGTMLERVLSVQCVDPPREPVRVDLDPTMYTFIFSCLDRARISVHMRDIKTAAGLVVTRSDDHYDLGYVVASMIPVPLL